MTASRVSPRLAATARLLMALALSACGKPSPLDADRGLHRGGELATTRSAIVALATPVADALAGMGSPSSTNSSKAPWPVPVLSIGHTIASYQSYGTGPYFHHGLDIRADAGTPVLASVGGIVVNVENYVPGSAAYWEVAIQDDQGYVWQYHHVDEASIPAAVHAAFASDGRLEAGAKLGEVVAWSVDTFGERYHHVHLNVLAPGGHFVNPFDFLTPLADDRAPIFVDVGLLQNGQRVPGDGGISGDYSVYAKVHDLVLHDQFVVPPRLITYAVDGAAPRTVWDFGSLPGGDSKTLHVDRYFVESMTCGDYECRELTVDLGFGAADGEIWFPKTEGAHSVAITARDDVGNVATTTFAWTVAPSPPQSSSQSLNAW